MDDKTLRLEIANTYTDLFVYVETDVRVGEQNILLTENKFV